MILLAPDRVELLHAVLDTDGHGWATVEPAGVAWWGDGNLQLGVPVGSPTASEAGGAGPYQPRHVESGALYLPEDCPVVPGNLLRVRGRVWVAGLVQTVVDPTGTSSLTSLVVQVSEREEVAAGG